MLLKALVDLAERDGLTADADYEPREVAWLVTVGEGGRLLGVSRTEGGAAARGRSRSKVFAVPRRAGRTSGDAADFLVDKAEYVLGYGERDEEKLERRRALFADKVAEAAEATADDGLMAVGALLKRKGNRDKIIRHLEKKDSGFKSNDLFAFVYEPDVDRLVSDRPAVRKYWAARRAESLTGDKTQSLVTGRRCVPVDKHPPVKGVPGSSTSGASLVSFNAGAFESYGLSRNANAPMSREAAEGYTSALNRLLSRHYVDTSTGETLPQLNVRLSADSVAVFWSKEKAELVDALSALFDSPDPAQVEALLRSPHRGRRASRVDDSAFYVAILSGAQGRIVLRGWTVSTVAGARRNLAQYFDDLAIVNPFKHETFLPALWRLLRSTAVRGEADNVAPNLAEKVFVAALMGRPFPRAVLEAAVRRTRIGGFANRKEFPLERAALIKACLARELRSDSSALRLRHPEIRKVGKEMDSECRDPAYRLGRLFAVLEKLQGAAINSPNATIADRYYGSASTRPAMVFPTLMRLAQHHASKAKHGGWYGKLMDEILEPVGEWPKTLAVEGQGLFALGYHHQRAELWKPKAKKEAGGDA